MGKVLITDCWTRKAISIVRALGRENIEVYTITHTLLSPAIFSKYSEKHFIFPLAQEQPEFYKKNLIELLEKEHFDCLIALEEPTIEIIYSAEEEIRKYTYIALPEKEIYLKANDKWETLTIAKQIGIPVPESKIYPDKTSKAAEALEVGDLKFPIMLKPRKSSGSRGLKRINSIDEFNKHYPVIKTKYGIPIIQECLPREGQGLGVACLAERGITKVSFSYKRLREFPVTGGPGTLNESTDESRIKDYAERLLKALNWTGVAMVEFKMDSRDNIPKLMEINPRFWGSIQLSIVSGINFPYLLFLQSTGKPMPEQTYNTGIRSRWLIAGDIMHFIKNPKRFKLNPSFFSFFDKNTYYSQYDKEDMRGNIAVIICSILQIFSVKRWKKGVLRK